MINIGGTMNRIWTMRLSALLILLSVPFLPGKLPAKTADNNLNIGLDYTGGFNSNIFMNSLDVKDFESRFQGDLGYSLGNAYVYLETWAALYADNPGFNAFLVEPGIKYVGTLKKRNTFFLGLGYEIMGNNSFYSDFDYNGPRFQAGVKLYLTPRLLFQAGYKFQSRNYTNYSSFDFINHTGFVELKRQFRSQTRVHLQGGFNWRYYPHVADEMDFGDDYQYYCNPRSRGKNKRPPSPKSARSHSLEIPHLYATIGIAQSFGPRVELSSEIELRHHFRGLENADALIRNSYLLFPFNDDLLWHGQRFLLRAKAVIFKGVAIEGDVSYFNKNYRDIAVRDLEGNVIEPTRRRKDNVILYHLKISKRLGRFDLFSNFRYRDNDSGDPYFTYRMVTVSAGVGWFL